MDQQYFETMEILLRQVVKGQENLDRGIDKLDARMNKLDGRMDQLDDRLDHLDKCVDGFKVELGKLTDELARTRRDTTEELTDLNAKIDSGFPNADMVSHRHAHEEMIEDAKRWHEYKGSVVKKLLEWSAVGAAVLVVTAIWEYVQKSLG